MLQYGSQNSLDESSQKQLKWEPFKTQSHFAKIMEQINLFKKNDSFCDVTLVVEDREIRAHKMILAACSKYFHIMFTSFKESKEDRITLQLISYEALNLIVDYIYTSEVLINEYTVQILLPAANMLQITEVQNACCGYLNSALCDFNCIGIRTFADTHNCKELYDRADAFIKRNFRFVTKHKEFLALPFEDFYEIISSNHLSVPNETLIWDCVIEWVNFDKEKRVQHADRLVEAVRFPLLPMSNLLKEDFTEHELFKNNSKVKDFIIEALRYVIRKDSNSLTYETNELRFQPRRPLVSPAIILTIGGQSPKAIKSVEYYDFDEEKWSELPQMPSRRCRSGVAVVNQTVYLIGGFNSNARVRTVEKYDFVHSRWTPCANMRLKRSTLGVGACDENVYAVGGFDGVMGLNSAEVYDTRTNLWQDIAKMIHRRSSVGVGVLNGKVYAVGGYDGFFKTCLNSVECFDPSLNSWQFVSCMEFMRSGAGVGVLNGLLYAIGGHNGPTVWKTVEAYDSETNMWAQVADMNVRRRNVGVVAFNNLLYVIGGDDGKTNLDSIEVYSPDKNQWTLLSSKMITARSYAGVCVVDNVFGIFPHSFN